MEGVSMKQIAVISFLLGATLALDMFAADQVKVQTGLLRAASDSSSAVRVFRGIPYADPPVGDLRWKAPQPPTSWSGVRPADKFGPRCMQRAVFNDMEFRSNGMGEDCLYLNLWTPARSEQERLPVLVYFYGGGYRAGDGSEPRYDGASMAAKGIVALTVNYRLNVFGFLAHPELTNEAPYHASGNYGLLDQNAALRWVQRNVAAFGGDPKRVTIAGESAGSISVSAHVASPLSKDLLAGAIMESGSLIGSMTPRPLSEAEQDGVKFATGAGASSIAALRAITGEKVLELTAAPDTPRFGPTTDGHLLPKEVAAILDADEQARVPLLGGSNSEEQSARGLLRQDEPTPENYAKAVRALYGDRAEEALKLYPGSTSEEVLDSAMALAGDRFIGFSTWRFMEGHRKTAGKPVYRYYYAHPRPKFLGGYPEPPTGAGRASTPAPAPPRGAVHSAEIEYAMGNLGTNSHFEWGPADHKLSEIMQGYFVSFIKTGNPNGSGLPTWPTYDGSDGFQIMRLDVESRAEPEKTRPRYLFLDPFYVRPQ
jgi:para-nitrobenzyl esterase